MYKAINYSMNARFVGYYNGEIDRNLLLANEGIHTLVNRAVESAQKAKALPNTVEVAIYALVNCSLKRDDGSRKQTGLTNPEPAHCIFSCSAAVGGYCCCCCELGASLEAGAAYYGYLSGTGSVSAGASSSFWSPSASSSISASISSMSSSPPSSLSSEPSSR